MELYRILFGITLGIYGVAAALYLWRMVGKPAWPLRVATSTAMTGFVVHAAVMVTRGVQIHHAPLFSLLESLLFTAWVLVAIYLVIERRHRYTGLGTFIFPAAIILLILGVVFQHGTSTSLHPAFQSNWSIVHITSSLISYACFALAFSAALGYLLQEHLLKTKRIGALQQHLPSLEAVDRLAYEMVMLGFLTLTVGIVTGAIWAQSAWTHFWSWDAKETWSLVTWIVYAVYLHMRIISGWQGKWANRLLIAGFCCVVITYFGVSFFSKSLHSYKW